MQNLSKRLSTVAQLVKPGQRIADVGTDHGFLPVFLVKNKISPSAVACDINASPLSVCRSYVSSQGLENKIKCVISNGLENVFQNDVDCIVIAGVGGELIAEILSKCSWATKKSLVLNPMTHSEAVRKYLYSNGFLIENDLIVRESGHYYNVMNACYTGTVSSKNDTDYFLGNINDFSEKGYFLHLLNYFENKQKGGADYSDVIRAVKEKL